MSSSKLAEGLRRVDAALDGKKGEEKALLLVLDLWRDRRAPELADLADHLGLRIKRTALGKGSLDRMHCAAHAANQRAFVSKLSEPAWSTVRSFSLYGFESVPSSMLQMTNFRRLESLADVTLAFAGAAVRARPPHDLVKLGVRERSTTPSPADVGKALGVEWVGLPRLRELSLAFSHLLSPEHLTALVASSASRPLESLSLGGDMIPEGVGSIAAWLEPLTPTSVTRFTIFAGKGMVRIRESGSKEWREP